MRKIGFSYAGNFEEGWATYNLMKSAGIAPVQYTIAIVIDMIGIFNRIDLMVRTLELPLTKKVF